MSEIGLFISLFFSSKLKFPLKFIILLSYNTLLTSFFFLSYSLAWTLIVPIIDCGAYFSTTSGLCNMLNSSVASRPA